MSTSKNYPELEKGDIVVTSFGRFEYEGERYTEKLNPSSPWGEEIEFVQCDMGDIDVANIIRVEKRN